MTPKEFVTKYADFARQTQAKTGLSYIAILAQAALETGWAKSIPGNMFFGVKDRDKGQTGKGQLLRTVEYLDRPDVKFPEVISVTPMAGGKYKYIVRDWFRKYDTPEQCFTQHAEFFKGLKRYAKAWAVREDAEKFFVELQAAKYATAVDKNGKPNYAATLSAVAETIRTAIIKS